MRNWRREVAVTCVGLLRSENYGRVPGDCIDDWVEIARRLDIGVYFALSWGPPAARLYDDVIVVRPGRTRRQTCALIAHELAEFLLTTEYAAPFHFPTAPGTTQEADNHLVAREVERLLGLRGRRRRRQIILKTCAGHLFPKTLQRYCARKMTV